MKPLFTRMLWFLLLQVVIATWLGWSYVRRHAPETAYFAATGLKEARLMAPRPATLIVAGGSSVAFGQDSERLESELKMRVANLGLHLPLGLEFILNQAETLSLPGDRIVLALEYQFYTNYPAQGQFLVQQAEVAPGTIRYWTWPVWRDVLDRGLAIRAGVIVRSVLSKPGRLLVPKPPPRNLPADPYRIAGFNAAGDVVAPRVRSRSIELPEARAYRIFEHRPREVRQSLAQIEAFARRCETRGVAVALLFPPLEMTDYRNCAGELDRLVEEIRRWQAVPVLNSPAEAALEDEYFFDTNYHLTSAGVQRRHADLRRWLGAWVSRSLSL